MTPPLYKGRLGGINLAVLNSVQIYIRDDAGLDKARRDRAKKLLAIALKELHPGPVELSLLFTGDSGIKALNRRYLGKNRPTDVLSFPMDDPSVIGDIVISVDRAREQSKEFGVSLNEELARLLVHGLLHLLGYDHVKGGRQAKRMRDREEGLMELFRAKGFFKRAEPL